MDTKKEVMQATLLTLKIGLKDIIHQEEQNLQEDINGKLYLIKGFCLNQKRYLLNIILKKIEKKGYPY